MLINESVVEEAKAKVGAQHNERRRKRVKKANNAMR